MGWVQVSLKDFEKVKYKFQKHKFEKLKKVQYPWLVCSRCGLVLLKNKSTKKAVKLGCYHNFK